jgi:hypothetical protein
MMKPPGSDFSDGRFLVFDGERMAANLQELADPTGSMASL